MVSRRQYSSTLWLSYPILILCRNPGLFPLDGPGKPSCKGATEAMKILLAYQIRSDVLQWKIVESCCTAPAYLIPLPNATFCRLALDFHKNAKAFDHTSRSKLKLFDSTERVVRECLMSD